MDLTTLTLSLGLGINSNLAFQNDFKVEGRTGYHLKLEHDPSDFSILASYYDKEHKVLGQPLFKAGTIAAGVGYDIDLNDNLELNIGIGLATFAGADVQQVTSGKSRPGFPQAGNAIVGEAAFTYLVNRHANDGRSIPLSPESYQNYRQDYGSGWSHRSPEFFGRIGMTYKLSDQWELGTQINIFNPNTNMWIANSEIAQDVIDGGVKHPNFNPCAPQYAQVGCGWWTEDLAWDMNSVEFTINYRW
jgi:opacity protein-like surface antigen